MKNGPWSHISTNANDIAAMQKAHLNPKILSVIDWTHAVSDHDMLLLFLLIMVISQTSEEQITEWTTYRVEPLCVDTILINGKVCEVLVLILQCTDNFPQRVVKSVLLQAP